LFLKPLVDQKSIPCIKFCLTILNFSRSFQLGKEWKKVKPDYSSITNPSEMKIVIPSGYIKKFIKDFNIKTSMPTFDKKNIYLSSKAGPQGPATLTAHNNLLLYNYYEMQGIFNLTDEAGREFFIKSYNDAWNNNLKPNKINCLGKISFIKDPEAKLRLIAISDYFTQLYLKVINDKIFKILKLLPCDKTFTQDPFHHWDLNNKEKFWSLDLSSATDRFPIKLQKRLLYYIFKENDDLSNSWMYLLSNRKFMTPEGFTVSYKTGQPMGTYSSWAVFTLTHHLFVHWCAHLNGINNFNQYMILGDDIVIKNDKVANTYIKYIKLLGVELSLAKTHVSNDTYEFAKRWIRPNEKLELTGIPIKGIVENFKNPFIVFTIIYDYFKIKKNSYYSSYSLVRLICNLYYKFSYYKGKKKFFLNINKKTYNKIRAFSLALDIEFNYYTYDKLRSLFVNKNNNDQYVIPNERVALLEYKRILSVGLAKVVSNINSNIINTPSNLLSKFDVVDKNELRWNTLFISIYNVINRQWEIVKQWDLSLELTLLESVHEICDLNIDSIFNKERNKLSSLLNIGKILNKGFAYNNTIDEIYYGSSWTESTFTSPIDQVKNLQKNFSQNLLNSVMEGKWEAQPTADDYIKRWENFKL